jgi:hypothetical protein
MSLRRRSAGHGSLRKFTPTRAAFARPGPGTIPFPDVNARMQPSDSLTLVGLGWRRPFHINVGPTSSRALVLCRRKRPATCASRKHAARRRSVIGSPLAGFFTRKSEGLPGFWAVLFVRAMVEDPARCSSLLARSSERLPSPSGNPTPWAPGMTIAFVAAWPTAHALAYLRIAVLVTECVARLATGLGGLTPDRTGFAPAGRQTKLHDFIASSIPSDQPAWPHWIAYPHLRLRVPGVVLQVRLHWFIVPG